MPEPEKALVPWSAQEPVIEHVTFMKNIHLVTLGGVRGTLDACKPEMRDIDMIRRGDGIVLLKKGAHLCDVIGNANIAATREHYSLTFAADSAPTERVQAPAAVPASSGQVRSVPDPEATGGVRERREVQVDSRGKTKRQNTRGTRYSSLPRKS